jgi:hypothetical protein
MDNPTAQMELYDIYDVWHTPWYKTMYFYGFVGIVCVTVLYLVYRWYANRKVPIHTLSPQEHALKILEKLKKGSYENHQIAYSILTHTLKAYLESYYKISLVGQTDVEFLETIATFHHSSPSLMNDLKTIFEGVAFIKFAGQAAQKEQFRKACELAENIINSSIA